MEFSQETIRFLNNSVDWPIKGEILLEELEKNIEVPDSEREIFFDKIDPEREYVNPDQVIRDLELEETDIEDKF